MVLKRGRSLNNEIRGRLDGAFLVAVRTNIVSDRTGRQHRARVRFDSRPQFDVFLVESSGGWMFVNGSMMLAVTSAVGRFLYKIRFSIKKQNLSNKT